jgi:hypothetical protein
VRVGAGIIDQRCGQRTGQATESVRVDVLRLDEAKRRGVEQESREWRVARATAK